MPSLQDEIRRRFHGLVLCFGSPEKLSMVTFTSGDIFNSAAQVITNTINTVGVMGVGLALKFKTRYPQMFKDYHQRCANEKVKQSSSSERSEVVALPHSSP